MGKLAQGVPKSVREAAAVNLRVGPGRTHRELAAYSAVYVNRRKTAGTTGACPIRACQNSVSKRD